VRRYFRLGCVPGQGCYAAKVFKKAGGGGGGGGHWAGGQGTSFQGFSPAGSPGDNKDLLARLPPFILVGPPKRNLARGKTAHRFRAGGARSGGGETGQLDGARCRGIRGPAKPTKDVWRGDGIAWFCWISHHQWGTRGRWGGTSRRKKHQNSALAAMIFRNKGGDPQDLRNHPLPPKKRMGGRRHWGSGGGKTSQAGTKDEAWGLGREGGCFSLRHGRGDWGKGAFGQRKNSGRGPRERGGREIMGGRGAENQRFGHERGPRGTWGKGVAGLHFHDLIRGGLPRLVRGTFRETCPNFLGSKKRGTTRGREDFRALLKDCGDNTPKMEENRAPAFEGGGEKIPRKATGKPKKTAGTKNKNKGLGPA